MKIIKILIPLLFVIVLGLNAKDKNYGDTYRVNLKGYHDIISNFNICLVEWKCSVP